MAVVDFKSLFTWELFPEERLDLLAEIPDAPHFTPKKADRKKVVLDETGVVVSYSAGEGAARGGESGYLVRFAVCLFRENAEVVKAKLKEKGVESVIWKVKRELSAYRLKIGPIPDSITKEKIMEAMGEIESSPLPFVSGRYMLSEPVLIKNSALKTKEKIEGMSVAALLVTEKKSTTVFKVTSTPFRDNSQAKESLKKWRKMDIEGIVEKIDS
jgi:hypothetical protein